MAFDGIVTKSIIAELNTCLIDGKISKIFQPNTNEVLLGIYANKKNYALAIDTSASHYRMHLTTSAKPNPMIAPNFCMVLRKHLMGSKILSFSSQDLERIIEIELESYNELNDLVHKKLIIELMGKHSNIILVNENNHIIDSLRHLDTLSGSYRDIMPAREYVYPTSDKHSFLALINFEEFSSLIDLSQDISKQVCEHFTGISLSFIENMLQQLDLPSSLTLTQLEKLYHTIKELLQAIPSETVSCINWKKDFTLWFEKKETSLSINFFLDDFYTQKEVSDDFSSYRNSILKLILVSLKKYTKRLENINNKLKDCEHMDMYRLYGELITANLYRIPNENLSSVTLENYYEENRQIVIPLDTQFSPAQNAKRYFKKYAKFKNTLDVVTTQKIETQRELNYIESIVYELENSYNIIEVQEIYQEISENVLFKDKLQKEKKSSNVNKKKKEEALSPMEFAIDGFSVLVGRNNKQNDNVTFKLARSNDIWFHTKDIHGSHVILKRPNKEEVPQEILLKCACLAAFYSKAKLSSNVPVDYTYVSYVKKPTGAKPGMVIYTNNKTLYVEPKNSF